MQAPLTLLPSSLTLHGHVARSAVLRVQAEVLTPGCAILQDELTGGAGADARRRRLSANDAARLNAHRSGAEATYYEEDEVRPA